MAVTSVNTFGLSEEQVMMRDSVLDLLERVMPADKIRKLDKAGEFPHEAFRALAKAGWLGIIYPEKFGGMGGSYKDLAVLVEAMAYHYGGIATAFLTTVIYAGMHVNLYARPEVAAVIMPEVIAGEAPMSVAITEPGTGSDVAQITTSAKRDGDHFVINGTKMYITCAHVARYIVVVTKTNPAETHRGVTLFLVDTRSPGVTVRPLETLGRHTKLGASLLVMSIVGGAIIPAAMGWISDRLSIQTAFALPLVCYGYVLYFALRGHVAKPSGVLP